MKNDQSNPQLGFRNSPFDQREPDWSLRKKPISQGIVKLVTNPIADSRHKEANEEASDQKYSPMSAITSHSTLRSSATDDHGLMDYNTVMGSVFLYGKDGEESEGQEQQMREGLKTSLINQLDELVQDDSQETNMYPIKKLELFECIEAYSDQSDSEDGYLGSGSLLLVKRKEVAKQSSPTHFSVIQSSKTQLLQGRNLDISREGSMLTDLPSNKRHIIRNFFKPKRQHQHSMKDDKTSCNSRELLEQMEELKSSRGLQSTGTIIKQRVFGQK